MYVGAHLYAPGVLAMETNTGLSECVNIFADIDGLCKRGATTFDSPNKRIIATGKVLMQRHQLFRNNVTPRYNFCNYNIWHVPPRYFLT